jgi:hypothetical protein
MDGHARVAVERDEEKYGSGQNHSNNADMRHKPSGTKIIMLNSVARFHGLEK